MAKQKPNTIWKRIAVGVIAIFILIIFLGILRAYHFRPEHHSIPSTQFDTAKKSVATDLSSHGDSIDNYKVTISNDARTIGDDTKRDVIQISLQKNATIQHYLIDADSGEIVMHTVTTFYGWLAGSLSKPSRDDWMFPWRMSR